MLVFQSSLLPVQAVIGLRLLVIQAVTLFLFFLQTLRLAYFLCRRLYNSAFCRVDSVEKIVVLIFVDRLLPSGRFHSACGISGRLQCKQSRSGQFADLLLIAEFLDTELVFCPELFTLKFQLTLRLFVGLQPTLIHRLAELIAVGRLFLRLILSLSTSQSCLVRPELRLADFRLI